MLATAYEGLYIFNMIDTSSWVEYKALTKDQYEDSMKKRLYAGVIEEERPYWLYVATQGIGPWAVATTVNIEFLMDQENDTRMGGVAINLCLKNTRREIVFKFKSFLEESGFWAPESGASLTLTSRSAIFALIRGYFSDVGPTDINMLELDVALDLFLERESLDRAPVTPSTYGRTD